MVFDFIEPYRIWVERVVFRLFSRKMVNANHTTAHDGGLRINADGKKLLLEQLRDYFDEKKEELDGNIVTRDNYLRQSASQFGQRVLKLAQGEVAEFNDLVMSDD